VFLDILEACANIFYIYNREDRPIRSEFYYMRSYTEKSVIKQPALLLCCTIYLLCALLRALSYNRISKPCALYYTLELLSLARFLSLSLSLLSLSIIDNLYNKLLKTIYISKIVLRIEVDIDFLYNYLCINFF